MKIVIDIPAEDFEAYKMQVKTIEQEGIYYESSNYELKRLIANGTPLPDGAEILTKEAYSDLCTRAADVSDTNVEEFRQTVLDAVETDCSWDMFDEWGNRTPIGECIIEAIKRVPTVEPEKCGDCIEKQKAISELKPPTDDWETYADRLYDLAYLRGYIDGLIAKGNRDNNV